MPIPPGARARTPGVIPSPALIAPFSTSNVADSTNNIRFVVASIELRIGAILAMPIPADGLASV
jgi:hypothetical protein